MKTAIGRQTFAQNLEIWSAIKRRSCPLYSFGLATATVSVRLLLFMLLLGFAMLPGCGGAGSQTGTNLLQTLPPPPPPPPRTQPAMTPVVVNIGYFASIPGDSGATEDTIVYFNLPINSVALRSSNGDVQLLPSDLLPNERRF